MKKTLLNLTLALFSITIIAQNHSFEWAKSIGGTSGDYGRSITTDVSGNVYTTGYYSGTCDFDPSVGTLNLTSAGNMDIFIQKLDPNGNLLWAKSMGGTSDDRGQSITTDVSGNVYTTGYFSYTVDFDPGAGTLNLTSAGNMDIFIQKLDPNGNFLWAISMGGTDDDQGQSITTDASGNMYTTGYFQYTVDFDPGAGTLNLTSAGDYDIFIQKLNPNGNIIWARSMGGTDYDIGNSITTDASGNVYTTGDFSYTVDFDPGTDTLNLTSAGYDDIFIQKLDPNGNFLWARSMGGTNSEEGSSITTDANGNVYTTGSFQGTADFDPGAGTLNLTSAGFPDIFIQKLDPNGNLLWTRSMGETSFDQGQSITTDASGNVYTTGYFNNTVDFDPGAGTLNLTSAGYNDIFIQKLDSNGNLIWAKSIGGNYSDNAVSIATDASGNVYTTGFFQYTVDFDPDAGTFNLSSAGNMDIFIQKLIPGGGSIKLCDTLSNFSKTNSPILYLSSNGGYTSGHNNYGDIAKADMFSAINGSQLEKAELNLWGYDATGSSTVNVNVWDESGGQPSNIIATQSISIGSFSSNTNGTQKTMVQFNSPITISGNFYIGVELDYSNGDTVALFTNLDGESIPGTAWEKWSGGTWYPYSSSDAWSMNVSHDITIHTCQVVTNINKQHSNDNFRIYPNPFSTSTTIELPPEPHILTIYDIVGNKLREEQVIGKTIIERGDLTKGIYIIEVRSESNTYKGKVVVE